MNPGAFACARPPPPRRRGGRTVLRGRRRRSHVVARSLRRRSAHPLRRRSRRASCRAGVGRARSRRRRRALTGRVLLLLARGESVPDRAVAGRCAPRCHVPRSDDLRRLEAPTRAGLDLRNRLLWKLAPPYATAISSPDEPETGSSGESGARDAAGEAVGVRRGSVCGDESRARVPRFEGERDDFPVITPRVVRAFVPHCTRFASHLR
jgi:hypothetical protein